MIYLILLISLIPLAYSDCDSEKAVCKTNLCNVLVEDIMSHVNLSVSPSVEPTAFYCSNYSRNVLFETSSRSELDKMMQNVLEEEYNGPHIIAAVPKLYKSCANSDKDVEFHKQVEQFIAEVGGCPLLNKTWNETDYNLEKAVGILMAKHGIDALFSFDYRPHEIHIGGSYEDLRALQNKSMFENLFQSFSAVVISSEELDRSRSELLNIQQIVNKAGQGHTWNQLSFKAQNLRFNHNISSFNWNTLLDTLSAQAGIPISNDTVLSETIRGNTFEELPKLVQKTSKRTMANFIVWRLINTYNPDTFFADKEDLAFEEKKPLGIKCLERVGGEFGYIVTKLLMDKFVTENMRNDLKRITQIGKAAVNNYVDKLDWMDIKTKLKAHKKIKKMKLLVRFDEYFKDSKSMIETFEKNYSILKKLTGGNFAKELSLLNLNRFKDKFSELLAHRKSYEFLKEDPKSNNISILDIGLFYPDYVKNGPFVSNLATFGTLMARKLFEKIETNADKLFTSKTMEKYRALKKAEYENRNSDTVEFDQQMKIEIFAELFKAYVAKNGESESSLRLPGLLTNYSISTDFLLSFTNRECLKHGPNRGDRSTRAIVKQFGNDMLKRC